MRAFYRKTSNMPTHLLQKHCLFLHTNKKLFFWRKFCETSVFLWSDGIKLDSVAIPLLIAKGRRQKQKQKLVVGDGAAVPTLFRLISSAYTGNRLFLLEECLAVVLF
jgi:hypothetical protein